MFDAKTLEVFIASPNDLQDERNAVAEALLDWNLSNNPRRQIMLKPVRWDKDTMPQIGNKEPQDYIDPYLKRSDIVIAMIGKRVGSPTSKSISGTVGEIETAVSMEKPVLLYFSRLVRTDDIDPTEKMRVDQLREEMSKRGRLGEFKSVSDLKSQLRDHLDILLQGFNPLVLTPAETLADGYFLNFISQIYGFMAEGRAYLPDYEVELTFESSRIRIARPESLDQANNEDVLKLKSNRYVEVGIKAPLGGRRPFLVYVDKGFWGKIQPSFAPQSEPSARKQVPIGSLDVVDFPTPLIALRNLVANVEKQSDYAESSVARLYWDTEKSEQFTKFFDYVRDRIRDGSIGERSCAITSYDYASNVDENLSRKGAAATKL